MTTGIENPVLCEVTRGDMTESRHRGAFAVMRATGELIASSGDVNAPTYGRSAIKPLQALPLVESGAADAFSLTEKQIALSVASHNSEPGHVDAVREWLGQIGLDDSRLECGPHLPYYEPSAHHMLREGEQTTSAHNNCSGKHCGFLTTAQYLGEDPAGYINPDHPVQKRLRAVLAEMTDTNLDNAPTGFDGCGIPVIGLSLQATAYAMARFASPDALPEPRRQAAKRIFEAVMKEPFMIAGSGRFCTDVITALRPRVLVKTGAEAYYCAAIPELQAGIALKIDDGNKRGSEVVMARILGALLDTDALNDRQSVAHFNTTGRNVGAIRAVNIEGL